ncbi:TRAP transporter large permease [Kaistia terrae]|jgi:tripartite ATP-independent transporter DctM subunit|uniref:TRAP transporter large permease protein n=1 Tax=Kaistia terrae TaxID=537017 RepID=A0ABW0Q301_9HYPH|nr:TRAP transporter large permease [Kaistia terrae]MCX5579781.1 TRAP transporter large permease [Kaistia terrae]
MIMLGVLSVTFLALALLAVPIAIALGVSALIIVAIWGMPGFILAQKMVNGIDSFPLLAVPFFILAASVMNSGGITTRVVDLFSSALGRIRGSSGVVNVGTNVFLAGISGSAVADASASGALLIPEMRKEGYSGGFAAALTAGAAVIGPIIPPSIPLVIYGVIAQVSITKLFVGAYIPGLMIASALIAYVIFYAKKHNLPARGRRPWGVIGKQFKGSAWALSMPLLLIVGAKGGLFTVTELGAVLVLYAIFVGWVIHREFKWRLFPGMLTEAGLQTANIMLVVAVSSFIAYLVVVHGIPRDIQALLHGADLAPWEFLLIVNVIFLVAGMFLDSTPATIILVPIFLPAATSFGIDPTHFGLVIVLNLMVGLIHPPLGLNLLITQSIAKVPMREVLWASLPIVGIVLCVLLVITFVPQTVLWLPHVMGM